MNDVRDEIDYIIDNFNFEKVERVMKFLDWKWHTPICVGIPDVSELRAYARKLINAAINDIHGDTGTIKRACGGFSVEVEKTTEKVYIYLSFEVANWDNHG